VLAVLAAALPVQATVVALTGGGTPHAAQVAQGVWIFKALLAVHALILAFIAWRPAPARAGGTAPRAEKRSEPLTRAELGMLVGLLIAGLVLRLHGLGEGLWFDEIRTLISYVRLPMGQLITTFDSQNQHMLYSIGARTAVVALGESPEALRLPAALFGVASLAALFAFGSMVAGRREALLATAFLTFSYHHVWFSQNARGYTALLLFTILGSAFFLRLLSKEQSAGWGHAAAYGALMAFAVYTHVTAVFVVAGHALVWLVLLGTTPDSRRAPQVWPPLMGLLLAGTLSVQLYALVLPQFMNTLLAPTMEGMATEWKNPVWLITETIGVLGEGLPGGLVGVVAVLFVVLAGLVSYWKRSKVVTGVMVLPGVLMAVVLLVTKHNMWPRFFFFAAGFAALITVRGSVALLELVLKTHGRRLATAGVAVAIAGSAFTVPGAYHPKQDYAGAREFVEKQRTADDAIVTVDMTQFAYQNYLAPNFLGIASEQELERLESSHRRTWILYTFPTRLKVVQPEIWNRLETRYDKAAEFYGTVSGGTVVVKVSK
jgi:hypothetical protein